MASTEFQPSIPNPTVALGPTQVPPLPVATTSSTLEPINSDLMTEIKGFEADSLARYKFNNRWDIVLSVLGIVLSITVVAAGFLKNPEVSAVLGAVVGAVVTAQKAFPFGQRAAFYRLLIGQAGNLSTRASQGSVSKSTVIDTLSALRMDFAQQLPRGSSSQTSGHPMRDAGEPAPPTEGDGQNGKFVSKSN